MASGVQPASQQGILQKLISFPISASFPERDGGLYHCRQLPPCTPDILPPEGFSLHPKLLTASVKGITQNIC
jgi:hypothetical protein